MHNIYMYKYTNIVIIKKQTFLLFLYVLILKKILEDWKKNLKLNFQKRWHNTLKIRKVNI